MIPRRLQLKNFLSYGSSLQEIDFTRYNLICLSGKNGHGKSALLDAITWALWGHARKVSTSVKADAGLLHLGQSQMLVVLDFELGDVLYRIRREFTQGPNKSYTTLEFGMLSTQTERFMPLTEKTTRDTQQKIELTLRIDYNAFVNSAFLRQGNANEFSSKSPKERKEIIGAILGLNQYDAIRKLAMERAREATIQKQTLCAFNERIDTELSKADEISAKTNILNKKLAEVTGTEKKIATTRTSLDKKQTDLNETQKKQELLAFSYKQLSSREQELRQQLLETRNTWRNVHAQSLKVATGTDPNKERARLLTELEKHQKQLHASLEQKEALLKKKETLNQIEQALRTRHAQELQQAHLVAERLNHEQRTLEQQLETEQTQRASSEKEAKEIAGQLKEQEKLAKQDANQIEEQEKQCALFERRREYWQRFVAQGNCLSNEYKQLQLQQSGLAGGGDEPRCPLCEQNLSASRRKFLTSKSAQRIGLVKHQLTRMTRVIGTLKTTLITQHEQIKQHHKQQQEQATRIATLEQLRIQKAKLQTIHRELVVKIDELQKKLATHKTTADTKRAVVKKLQVSLEATLQADAKYTAAHTAVKKLEKEMSTSSYNAKAHERTRTQLKAIEDALAAQTTLHKELERQPERATEISRLCTALKGLKTEKQSAAQQMNALSKTIQEKTVQLSTQITQLERDAKELANHKELLMQERGTLAAQEKTLVRLRGDREKQLKEITGLDETIDDYGAIATATGKDGIQALLIEETIPEVEQEANELLAKLTDNQTQLFIESLRDLKKGGTKETLDIKISDPAGIRPYELFSGGEAFRIDFALRIAISKLLARRAGTALQTLVIDEGFGSQDEEGLSRIMDAIHKIQDEFAKVIIVSHLDALKDQFPIHFVVTKAAGCSNVSVVEHG